MFVSEANFLETELVRLRVINILGEIGRVEVDPSETVETLTFRVLNIFLKLEEPDKIINKFKLVSVPHSRVLSNENSIAAEGLKNDDEVLLVPKREPPSLDAITGESLKGPTQSDIDRVTAKLRNKSKELRSMTAETTADFQSELRKVIISIVEAAARVLAYTPQANQVIELMKEKQLRKSGQSLESKGCDIGRSEPGRGPSSARRSLPAPDPGVVAQLMDMGFSEEMVLRALRSRRMNQALEWLLENSSSEAGSWSTADDEDLEDDADLAESVDGQTNWTNSNLGSEPSDQEQFMTNEPLCTPTLTKEVFHGQVEGNRQQKSWSAAELLQSFEAFKKHQFRPSQKAMNALLDMGFSEDEVMEALKATGNNQVAACEWLLMENKTGISSASSSSSWEEADEGLDPNSPAFKAILAEPLVQLSLTNPKLLLAYLSILETPASASIWINDLDASPVLNQIFKTYNAEKHSLRTPEDDEVTNNYEATASE